MTLEEKINALRETSQSTHGMVRDIKERQDKSADNMERFIELQIEINAELMSMGKRHQQEHRQWAERHEQEHRQWVERHQQEHRQWAERHEQEHRQWMEQQEQRMKDHEERMEEMRREHQMNMRMLIPLAQKLGILDDSPPDEQDKS